MGGERSTILGIDLANGISRSTWIDGSVSIDHGLFAFDPFDRVAVFHPHDALISLAGDVGQYVAVVDLAGARFFSTRVVAALQIRDLVPAPIKVRNQVSLCDLLVILPRQPDREPPCRRRRS